jgi:hypothetical protein
VSTQIPAWIAAVAAVGGLLVAVLTYRIVRRTSVRVSWTARADKVNVGIRFALTNTGARKARDVVVTFGPDQPPKMLSATPGDIDAGAAHSVHFIESWGNAVQTVTVTWREGLLGRKHSWSTSIPGIA